jgi:hypothetical protein
MQNTFYCGDNLAVLQHLVAASLQVDLIFIIPSFCSQRTYQQHLAFRDTWQRAPAVATGYRQVLLIAPNAVDALLQGLQAAFGQNDFLIYLTHVTFRLLYLLQLLKPNGSLYLHCDSNASHTLKLLQLQCRWLSIDSNPACEPLLNARLAAPFQRVHYSR